MNDIFDKSESSDQKEISKKNTLREEIIDFFKFLFSYKPSSDLKKYYEKRMNEIMSPSRIEESGVCKSADLKSWSMQLSALHGYCSRIP